MLIFILLFLTIIITFIVGIVFIALCEHWIYIPVHKEISWRIKYKTLIRKFRTFIKKFIPER